jgi:hypothetical protein
MKHTARAAALAMGLGLAAGGCSSSSGGQLVSCVAPGAGCCAGNACAVGLACQNAVCVVVDADAEIDAATDSGDGGSTDGRASDGG